MPQVPVRAADQASRRSRSLSPEWMVLRPDELAYFQARDPHWLVSNYQLVRRFDVKDDLLHARPDATGALYDTVFLVLRRRPEVP